MFVLQIIGVIAHDAEGDLEGRSGRDPLRTIAVLDQGFSSVAIGNDRANRSGLRRGRQKPNSHHHD